MIQLHSVGKRYRGRREQAVLRDVNLRVDPGDVVLLSGAMGSGKSTLLGLLYAAHLADSGKVLLLDRDPARLRRASLARLRRLIGVIPQELALLMDRSALANVALALEVCAEPRASMRARAAHALSAVGLACEVDTPVRALSSGQKQLVAVARALVRNPAIVVADEPSAHLDNPGRDALVQVLLASCEHGSATVVATNDHKLLSAGAQLGWRHVEIHDCTLRVIAERTADTWHAGSDREPADHGDDGPEQAIEADNNVLPFPLAVHAGGLLE